MPDDPADPVMINYPSRVVMINYPAGVMVGIDFLLISDGPIVMRYST